MYTKIIIGSNCEEDYEWYGNISIDLKFKSLVIVRKFHELTWLFSWAMKNIIWPYSRKQNAQKHGGTEMGKDRVMFEVEQMVQYTKSMDRSRARKRVKIRQEKVRREFHEERPVCVRVLRRDRAWLL